MNSRKSGILLHPTSLPGTAGIGTIGKSAYEFVDWLEKGHQTLWQILPIGPTGYGDSPYASFSTFAGNPLIIDLDSLAEKNYISKKEITPPKYISSTGNVDFGSVVYWKIPLLKKAAKNFVEGDFQEKSDFEAFKSENAFWLNDYASFMSIKEFYDKKACEENKAGAMWGNFWPKKLAKHDDKAIEEWNQENKTDVEVQKAIQFFFFTQWKQLKNYANEKNVKIIGDIPIFVAYDSADVWANQKLFQLDKDSLPVSVAGVPPDYFSATGQLWGNPLYDWNAMKKSGYSWWIKRIQAMLNLVDYIRIDHFRGFEAYWSIPFGSENAINGKWMPGPDHALFKKIKEELGDLPIIAEDLGLITEGVQKLRDDFELPGMKVFQFGFSVNEKAEGHMVNAFLPHEYGSNFVVYTGTHDNETMQGYIDNASDEEKALICEYLTGGIPGLKLKDKDIVPCTIKTVFESVADTVVIPMQDVYSIGSKGRMNTPSTASGNWQWRMTSAMFSEDKAEWLKNLSALYDRN